jgi:iron-sulfur cluster assembly protein
MSEQATTTTSTPTEVAPATVEAPASKPAARGIAIHESAVRRLKQIQAEKNTPQGGMRLAVRGGGCSGLSYVMDWAEQPRERDKVFELDGARVFVDGKSMLYLAGTELVYEESLMSAMFKLNNPNVKSACGCGESFSV